MMATSTAAAPFAAAIPPPSPVIVLLYATDLCEVKSQPLLAHEDLPTQDRSLVSSHQLPTTPNPRYHPYRRSSSARLSPLPRTASSPLTSPETSDNGENSKIGDDPTCNVRLRSPLPTTPQPTPLQPQPTSEKIKVPRPKGAGRRPFLKLVNWEPVILEAIKVGLFVYSHSSSNMTLEIRSPQRF